MNVDANGTTCKQLTKTQDLFKANQCIPANHFLRIYLLNCAIQFFAQRNADQFLFLRSVLQTSNYRALVEPNHVCSQHR